MKAFEDLLLHLKHDTILLDSDPLTVSKAVGQVYEEAKKTMIADTLLLTNHQLRDVFATSACLAFTIWQNLSAVERIIQSDLWSQNNKNLWKDIVGFHKKIGLATTHLARSITPIHGIEKNGNYILQGILPWLSGYQLFDYFVIAFQAHDKNIVAVVSAEELTTSASTEVHRINLATYQGTNSISVRCNDFLIQKSQIVSITDIGQPTKKGKSIYIFPETGIAHRALDEIKHLLATMTDETKEQLLTTSADLIRNSLHKIERKAEADFTYIELVDLQFQRDQLIKNAVNLLVLAEAGKAVSQKGLGWLFAKQVLLLDIFIQPRELIEKKIVAMGQIWKDKEDI